MRLLWRLLPAALLVLQFDLGSGQVNGPTKVIIQALDSIASIPAPSHFGADNATQCSEVPSFPIEVQGTSGAVIDDRLVICGGGDAPYSSACYSLEPGLNVWTEDFPALPGIRYSAASALTAAGWWITGGTNGIDYLSSTVVLDSASAASWTDGPELPAARSSHCVANVNATHSFVAGGFYFWDAFLYDWQTDAWTQLPDLMTGRYEISCAMLDDGHVIVAGGYPSYQLVESLDLATLTWRQLPDLPDLVHTATFFRDGQDLILANPYHGNLMVYDEADESFHIIDGQSTEASGFYATVVPVGDVSLNECL